MNIRGSACVKNMLSCFHHFMNDCGVVKAAQNCLLPHTVQTYILPNLSSLRSLLCGVQGQTYLGACLAILTVKASFNKVSWLAHIIH